MMRRSLALGCLLALTASALATSGLELDGSFEPAIEGFKTKIDALKTQLDDAEAAVASSLTGADGRRKLQSWKFGKFLEPAIEEAKDKLEELEAHHGRKLSSFEKSYDSWSDFYAPAKEALVEKLDDLHADIAAAQDKLFGKWKKTGLEGPEEEKDHLFGRKLSSFDKSYDSWSDFYAPAKEALVEKLDDLHEEIEAAHDKLFGKWKKTGIEGPEEEKDHLFGRKLSSFDKSYDSWSDFYAPAKEALVEKLDDLHADIAAAQDKLFGKWKKGDPVEGPEPESKHLFGRKLSTFKGFDWDGLSGPAVEEIKSKYQEKIGKIFQG